MSGMSCPQVVYFVSRFTSHPPLVCRFVRHGSIPDLRGFHTPHGGSATDLSLLSGGGDSSHGTGGGGTHLRLLAALGSDSATTPTDSVTSKGAVATAAPPAAGTIATEPDERNPAQNDGGPASSRPTRGISPAGNGTRDNPSDWNVGGSALPSPANPAATQPSGAAWDSTDARVASSLHSDGMLGASPTEPEIGMERREDIEGAAVTVVAAAVAATPTAEAGSAAAAAALETTEGGVGRNVRIEGESPVAMLSLTPALAPTASAVVDAGLSIPDENVAKEGSRSGNNDNGIGSGEEGSAAGAVGERGVEVGTGVRDGVGLGRMRPTPPPAPVPMMSLSGHLIGSEVRQGDGGEEVLKCTWHAFVSEAVTWDHFSRYPQVLFIVGLFVRLFYASYCCTVCVIHTTFVRRFRPRRYTQLGKTHVHLLKRCFFTSLSDYKSPSVTLIKPRV